MSAAPLCEGEKDEVLIMIRIVVAHEPFFFEQFDDFFGVFIESMKGVYGAIGYIKYGVIGVNIKFIDAIGDIGFFKTGRA